MNRRRLAPRRTARPLHLDSFIPQLFRLEDRRVLDVSAAFSSATGQLELVLTGPAESATISLDAGQISVRDSHQQEVAIQIDGGGTAPVNASQVDAIRATGDATAS